MTFGFFCNVVYNYYSFDLLPYLTINGSYKNGIKIEKISFGWLFFEIYIVFG